MNISINKVQLVREPAHRYGIKNRSCRNAWYVNTILCEVLHLNEEPEEVFCALYTDVHNKLNGAMEINRGTLHQSPVSVAAVIRGALLHNAHGIILAHNHPSGDPTPSKEDINITAKIKEAAALFDIKVLDHVIVGDEEHYKYTSFQESRMI